MAERRLIQVGRLVAMAKSIHQSISLEIADFSRSEYLKTLGFKAIDALHAVAAEKAKCSVLLTTDDRFLAAAARNSSILKVSIKNPVIWLQEVLYL